MDCKRFGDEGLQGARMDVLYGEADVAARQRVEEHLAECAACREEMAALGGVRRDLRAWRLPVARPTFTPRGLVLPRWAAAAALLLIGFSAALGATGYASLRRSLAAQEARAADLERRHQDTVRALETALRGRPAGTVDTTALLASLDARLDERLRVTESRQREELRTRLASWEEQADAQRRVD
ncbi:MAG TPA: zf-HC2 domain-containing protein, partial [Vicinamibacteria bacterium]